MPEEQPALVSQYMTREEIAEALTPLFDLAKEHGRQIESMQRDIETVEFMLYIAYGLVTCMGILMLLVPVLR